MTEVPSKRPADNRRRLAMVRLLILLSAAALGAALTAPCMTVIPGAGKFATWVKLLQPDALRPTQYSLLGGIITMIQHRNYGIGMLLLFFSVIFPTAKLAAMAYSTHLIARGRPGGWVLAAAHHAGKFSMLDVLVLAIVVVAIKGLPGSTEVQLAYGVYLFACSVVVTLIGSILLRTGE